MSRSALSFGMVGVVLVAVLVIASASNALAAQVAKGVITSIDDDNGSFVLKVGDDDVTVTVNDDTSYTIDGEAADKDDVVSVGAKVTVTHEAGLASGIDRARG